jgi:hypothetical protein
LQPMEKPFRTATRLRRIGRDMFDAQMIQGASNLRQICSIDLATPASGVVKSWLLRSV